MSSDSAAQHYKTSIILGVLNIYSDLYLKAKTNSISTKLSFTKSEVGNVCNQATPKLKRDTSVSSHKVSLHSR